MTYIEGTDITNIIQCKHCKSIIGYDNDEVYLERATCFSWDIKENKIQVRRLIHCPNCGMPIVVSEIQQEGE